MESDELRTILNEAGFSPYEADAYITLLETGPSSASELATASAVPRARIYDVLRSLEDEGYVTLYDRDTLTAHPVDPSDALSSLRSTVSRFENAINAIEDRYEAPDELGGEVSVVRRFRTVFDHARTVVSNAENHLQLAATDTQVERLRSALRAAYERGVRIHLSLFVPPEETPPASEELRGISHEVRRRTLPGPFLLLADRQQACYATRGRRTNEYGVLVDDYATAYAFHWYFLTRLREVYDVVHDARSAEAPFTFVEITDCVRGIELALDAGATIRGRVIGRSRADGRRLSLSGEFVAVEYTGTRDETPATLLELAAKATVVFEADDTRYTVGGPGAAIEDIAADRIVVEELSEATDIRPV
ncbi:TrmB family transcriptional regulator [Haloterrigena sp. SYSU A121-1]|uniref:TrmB family transcriptional regulator n=1 Tax=Haloterrigena gelatinilytica TaxID=2741724 RepID=A0A8J8GNG4_9EURY|nr:TrmB family transcriptional regulator sugar-binding domain-containing protein [Haloterrigena gelatinilytica]NUB91642.1 TrmB family transcriptional regulator [Haloterrigena gelatinilytica]